MVTGPWNSPFWRQQTLSGANAKATELQWHEAQRRQCLELTALSQALMLLIGALAVMLMLWIPPAALAAIAARRAHRAVCFLRAGGFEALAPVTGAFQHLGQVIAFCALRITELTEQPR